MGEKTEPRMLRPLMESKAVVAGTNGEKTAEASMAMVAGTVVAQVAVGTRVMARVVVSLVIGSAPSVAHRSSHPSRNASSVGLGSLPVVEVGGGTEIMTGGTGIMTAGTND